MRVGVKYVLEFRARFCQQREDFLPLSRKEDQLKCSPQTQRLELAGVNNVTVIHASSIQ
jgi:hypothetical protein